MIPRVLSSVVRPAFRAGLALCAVSFGAAGHPEKFSSVVEKASPAVVHIQATSEWRGLDLPDDDVHRRIPDWLQRLFPDSEDYAEPLPAVASGSGFIVSSDGHIVTNHHVVDRADYIEVRLADRQTLPARVVGTDRATDIALLKVDARDLPVALIGSSEALKVGEWVIAIGSPFNFENSVTAGIVSAKGRSFSRQQYVPFLQTDVPINRGNSGGPLIDMRGQVVAVNSQIFSENGTYMGVSFSIPIEIAMAVVAQLSDRGYVSRGLLGVGIEDVSRELANALGMVEARGAIVTFVSPGSAAHRADIRPWDVIVGVNGRPIRTFSDLPPRVGLIEPGKVAQVELYRDRDLITLAVEIGALDENIPVIHGGRTDPTNTLAPPRLGLELQAGSAGLEVVAVNLQSTRRAGIQVGDLLTSGNGQPLQSLADIDALLDQSDAPIAFLVRRGLGRTFVVVRRPN